MTFQAPIEISSDSEKLEIIPRTFEESFIYTNFELVKSKKLDVMIEYPDSLSLDDHYTNTYTEVVKDFKKVEFALNQIETSENWIPPLYISEGLQWLSTTLRTTSETPLIPTSKV